MSTSPLRVGCIGMGWWSDVLADAIQRSGKLTIVSCYTRSEDKREKFGAKYRCRAAASYEAMLGDPEIEAIINTTPNDVHLATTRAAAAAGKHVFLDKPIANTVSDGRAITGACRKAGVVLALGYQRPGNTGAEEIFALVHRIRPEHGKNIVADKFLAQILNEDLLHTQLFRLRPRGLNLLTLPDIRGKRDHFAAVGVLQPFQNDGSIQPAGECEHDLVNFRHIGFGSYVHASTHLR